MISIGILLTLVGGGAFWLPRFRKKKLDREIRDALIRDKVARHEKVVDVMHVNQTEHSVRITHLEKQIEKHDSRLTHLERHP